MRILYIYAGKRKHLEALTDVPRTQFYGLHALKEMGFDVSYKEFEDVYPAFLARVLPFNIRHMLMYFPARKYDIVFGSSLIPTIFLKVFLGGKTKYILLNISLKRLLSSNFKKSGIKYKLINFLLSRFDGVVCLSVAQAMYLKEYSRIEHQKIFSVPLGVDNQFYKRNNDTCTDTIVSVGRDNGRDYRTVFSVAEMMPDRKFVVVCSKRNIEGLVVPKNVKVLYDISPKDVRTLYRTSKILLLLTHGGFYKDGADCSGQTVLIEAMATGLPSIVTSNPCILEYVETNKDVFIVEPYDVDGVVNNIKKLDDPLIRSNMSNASEKAVETKYSEFIMAKKLSEIFSSVYGN